MIVGVTGGVGTGKSTILQFLREEYQAAVILTDDVAKELTEPGGASYPSVVSYFGEEILTDGQGSPINRRRLSEIVFQDPEKLKALNAMTHPQVKVRTRELIAAYQASGRKLIVIETAILIQAGFLDLLDELWVIVTDYPVRVQRLMQSRGYSQEKIDTIISNQWTDEQMRRYADLVIDNSGDFCHAAQQIRNHLKDLD